jgi:hypothetical protein
MRKPAVSSASIPFQRIRPTPKGHLKPVPLHGLLRPPAGEVRTGDDERRVRLLRRERTCIRHGVGKTNTEMPPWLQHSCRLPDSTRHVLNIHERVIGHREIEGTGLEGQGCGVSDDVHSSGVGLLSQPHESRCGIHTDHAVAASRQVTTDPSLATAYL